MTRKSKVGFIILLLLSIGYIYVILFSGLMMHEKAHGSICEIYNGTPVYNYTLSKGITYCRNFTIEKQSEKELFHALNKMNEIYSYNLLDIKAILAFVFVFMIILVYFLVRISSNIEHYIQYKIEKRGEKS